MTPQGRTLDRRIAALASRAHGVVTWPELLEAGISAGAVKHRLERGTLIRAYPGVYRVGHRAPSLPAGYLAAVLACGTGALLRRLAAGHLWQVLRGAAPPPEVLTLTERRVPGVKTLRTRRPHALDVAVCRGVPITSVARTLVDLASVLATDDLARAAHEALIKHGTRPGHVETVLARRPTAPGAGKLRSVLRGEAPVTLSYLERRFLALLREARLPLPETNRPSGGWWVDCRWPAHRLTVELDSYRFHSSRHAWERDRRRERTARARGDDFRRYTFGDVAESPRLMLRELESLLPKLPA